MAMVQHMSPALAYVENNSSGKQMLSLCRICATSDSDIIDVFKEEGQSLDIVNKIHTYLPIRVTEQDLLPVTMCLYCVEKLEMCHEFVMTCLEADTKLKQMLGFEDEDEDDDNEDKDNDDNGDEGESDPRMVPKIEMSGTDTESDDGHEDMLPEPEQDNVDSNDVEHEGTNINSDKLSIIDVDKASNVNSDEVKKIKLDEVINIDADEADKINLDEAKNMSLDEANNMSVDETNNINLDEADQDSNEIQFIDSSAQESDTSAVYRCTYCEVILMGNDELVLHQITEHPDKVFVCTFCEPNLVFYEAKDFFQDHMASEHPECDIDEAVGNSVLKTILEGPENFTVKKVFLPSDDVLEEATSMLEDSEEIEDYQAFLESGEVSNDSSDITFQIIQDESNKENGKSFNNKINKKIVQSIKRKLANSAMRKEKVANMGQDSTLRDRNKIVQTVHTCSICEVAFYSKKNFLAHKASHECPMMFICEFCGRIFSQKRRLVEHLEVHKEGEIFQCDVCDKLFTSRRSYVHHKKNSHIDKIPLLCDICGKNIKNATDFRLHQLTHVDPESANRFPCEICGKMFRKKNVMQDHMLQHSNEKPHSCPDCSKSFRTKNLLRQHAMVHMDERNYQCPICGKSFRRKGNMHAHSKIHHDNYSAVTRTYTCNICSLKFATLESLYGHRNQHSKEEIAEAKAKKNSSVHECEICGKILQSKVTYQNHMMLHSGEIKCDVCGKIFVSKRSLEVHYRLHTGEKPFTCKYCGEGFITKSIMVIHERVHTGELPFKCDICGKAFRSSTGLIPHKKIHSEVRPFGCITCSRRFKRKDALEAHIRIHTGERPFVCQICGRGFKQRTDCKKHEATHYNYSRPVFPCSICKKHFRTTVSLSEHYRLRHNEEVEIREVVPKDEPDIMESAEFIIEDSMGNGEPIILEAAEFIISESVDVEVTEEEQLTLLDSNFMTA